MKKMFLCTVILCLFLVGCNSADEPEQTSVDVATSQTIGENIIEDSSAFSSVSAEEPVLKTYSDSYVSFTYDANMFTCDASKDSDVSVVTINCSSLPVTPENEHNTIISFSTVPNPNLPESSDYMIQLGLNVLAKTLCQGVFPLEDDESIIDEAVTYSDYVSEYYMEISDGSQCYAKTLNYNDYITTVIMRLCTYSSDYNDSFVDIYNSAKSEYGNFDFATISESLPADPEPVTASEPTPAPTSTPDSKPSSTVTVGQKNALKAAKDYLDYSAFSYNGLIAQLEYEGFTTEEATYAVDNCGADWNKQALDKAKDYLDYSSFSYKGLIQQLEYEKFTSEQATYGADNCGADWNKQAADKAKDYLDYSSFSRDSLIAQLEYEGFTHDQAVYGAQENGY